MHPFLEAVHCKSPAQSPLFQTDADLLALLIHRGPGQPGPRLRQRAARCLREAGGLHALAQRTQRGLAPGNRIEQLLGAALELAHRSLRDTLGERDLLDCPAAVATCLSLRMSHLPREVFCVLFLDCRNRLLRFEELFSGTLGQTAVYPREVARRALECNAAGVILAHNHPSGVTTPSTADRQLTHTLKQTLGCLEIPVLDHIIVGVGGHFSFAQAGLL